MRVRSSLLLSVSVCALVGACKFNPGLPTGASTGYVASAGATGSGTGGTGATGLSGAAGAAGPCTGIACNQSTCTMGSCTVPACAGGARTTVSGV
ncbi:MAG TPA: hypothetical protein VLA14_14800, partial [Polyangia bacterium]|nr:hypothetical protein [Polyangia bacterium]